MNKICRIFLFSIAFFSSGCGVIDSLNPWHEEPKAPPATEEVVTSEQEAESVRLEQTVQQEENTQTLSSETTQTQSTASSLANASGIDQQAQSFHSGVDSQRPVSVEVIWQVPKGPVDSYLLEYGFSADKLPHNVQIPLSQLKKVQHPIFGEVFRYQLKKLPADRRVFLRLTASNAEGSSPPTPVFEVQP